MKIRKGKLDFKDLLLQVKELNEEEKKIVKTVLEPTQSMEVVPTETGLATTSEVATTTTTATATSEPTILLLII